MCFPSSTMSSPARNCSCMAAPQAAASSRTHCHAMARCRVWSTSSPLPFLTLLAVELFFLLLSHTAHVLPSVKYTFPEPLPSWLSGTAECCGAAIGASRNQLCPALGSPSLALQPQSMYPHMPQTQMRMTGIYLDGGTENLLCIFL